VIRERIEKIRKSDFLVSEWVLVLEKER